MGQTRKAGTDPSVHENLLLIMEVFRRPVNKQISASTYV